MFFCGLLCLTDAAAAVFVALHCTQVCHQNHCVPAVVKCDLTFEIFSDLFVEKYFQYLRVASAVKSERQNLHASWLKLSGRHLLLSGSVSFCQKAVGGFEIFAWPSSSSRVSRVGWCLQSCEAVCRLKGTTPAKVGGIWDRERYSGAIFRSALGKSAWEHCVAFAPIALFLLSALFSSECTLRVWAAIRARATQAPHAFCGWEAI